MNGRPGLLEGVLKVMHTQCIPNAYPHCMRCVPASDAQYMYQSFPNQHLLRFTTHAGRTRAEQAQLNHVWPNLEIGLANGEREQEVVMYLDSLVICGRCQ